MNHITIKEIEFNAIYPVWRDYLWPGRVSFIEPLSIINPWGELTLNPRDLGTPYFWGAFLSHHVHPLGVLSGFSVGKESFRCRGLWVNPKERTKGIGHLLLRRAEEKAIDLNLNWIWTMPRLSALSFYLKYGFRIERWVHSYEFGPHMIVHRHLK